MTSETKEVFKALSKEKLNWDNVVDGDVTGEMRYGDENAPPDILVHQHGGDIWSFEPVSDIGELFCELHGLS